MAWCSSFGSELRSSTNSLVAISTTVELVFVYELDDL